MVLNIYLFMQLTGYQIFIISALATTAKIIPKPAFHDKTHDTRWKIH